MAIKIKGQQYYLWRAVDANGQVIDILMQSHRNEAAANKFFRKLLKPQTTAPRVIVTDKLKSYGAAKKKILRSIDPPESGSDAWNASNHRGRPNAFSQLLSQYEDISIPPAQTSSNEF